MQRSFHSRLCIAWIAGCGAASDSGASAAGTIVPPMAAVSHSAPATSNLAASVAGSSATPAHPASVPIRSASSMLAAGSGAAPATASTNQDDCPDRFTLATRATVDMSWPETVGYFAGESKLQAWTKTTHTRSATGTTTEVKLCGVALPVVTTTPLLDGVQLANEIPLASFDLPSMPKLSGSSTRQAGQIRIDSDVVLLGVALSEPSATWPTRAQLMAADHDADGKLGVTAIPKSGGPYGLPPADIGQTIFADRVYTASRLSLRLETSQSLCEQRVEGRVTPLRFDYTIVGCHVQGGGECQDNQVNLLDNNDPAFTLGEGGRWVGIPVAEDETCAGVLLTLPAE